MTDKITKERRSYTMSRIRSRDTKPEVLVRKYLFSRGLRFRKNDKRLPGHPDVVLPKYRAAVFVNGCFWHQHEGCRHAGIPDDNREYWEEKFRRNKKRDAEKTRLLELAGWRVIVVWECQLMPKVRADALDDLYNEITAYAGLMPAPAMVAEEPAAYVVDGAEN